MKLPTYMNGGRGIIKLGQSKKRGTDLNEADTKPSDFNPLKLNMFLIIPFTDYESKFLLNSS